MGGFAGALDGNLKGKTLLITGASRGIGRAIAVRAAQDGADIIVTGKTEVAHPTLEGTIFDAAEEIEKAGGRALACKLDVRDAAQVAEVVERAVEHFGGLDILVNNASAIALSPTLSTTVKRFDLMHQVNTRGTFLCCQAALPHLLKRSRPHILNLAPPLNLKAQWFEGHLAYSIAKYGMSLCVLGLAEEFKGRVAVNALWPRTIIATAALSAIVGGEKMIQGARHPRIVADAAHSILTRPLDCSGNFFLDEEVLSAAGVTDFDQYAVNPSRKLFPDLFL